MLRVLGRVTSINVRKVLWALDELGLAYEREDWGLPLRDPNVPEFLALNPNAQVPVLIDGDLVLWESNAILMHLGEGTDLLPSERKRRALVLQWLVWQATELNPPWGYAVQALIRKVPGYNDPAKVAQSLDRWGHRMTLLQGQLSAGGPYVGGKDFSIADIALGLSVHRWMSIPADKPDFPVIEDYYNLLLSREAGARWMGPETP